MGGACSMHGPRKKFIQTLVGKAEGKRTLGRPRCNWGHNIKMNINEKVFQDVDWIHQAQDKRPMTGSCEYCNKFSSSIKGENFMSS
jgi:hypothetical protein